MNSEEQSSDPDTWIRVSTAAQLRKVKRQAIYYHIREEHLQVKNLDGVLFVLRAEVLSLEMKRAPKQP